MATADEIFSEANRLGRDRAEGWFKFEKVGDRVGGTIIDMFEMPARDGYQAQRCFTLETTEGKILNVGLKRTSYTLARTDNLQIGDDIGLLFEKEIPATQRGHHAAKSISIYPVVKGPRKAGASARDMEVDASAGQEDPNALFGFGGSAGAAPAMTPATAPASAAPMSTGVVSQPVAGGVSEAHSAIRTLARTKGLVTPEMTDEQADATIVAFAGMPLNEETYTKVIIKLTSFSAG